MRKWLWRLALSVSLLGCGVAAANYTATVGSGTTFASIAISTVNYAAMVICDATNGTAACSTVKAASTAAVATDPAMVVAISPNNGVGLNAGSNIVGKVGIDQTTPGTTNGVQVNAALPAGANTIGGVTGALGTTNGWTTKLLNALSTTVTAVKASGGQLGKLYCWNPNSSVVYVQVFNVASGSVTLGTTTPAQSFGIPPTNSSGYTLSLTGDEYGTAISVAATTTATGSTAPGTAVDCNASFN